MKFKKDGKVFEDIKSARDAYCYGKSCRSCVLYRKWETNACIDILKKDPAEAGRLMGYEVGEEETLQSTCNQKEVNMDKQKPRICEVLGVEVGEKFHVEGYGDYWVDENGQMRWRGDIGLFSTCEVLCNIINGKRGIQRLPRFTEEEVAENRSTKIYSSRKDYTSILLRQV